MRMDVVLPEIGDGMTEAFVVQWLKQVGDWVEVDEPLVEMITDKANVEIPSTAAGIVEELCFAEEARVKVGEVLAVIRIPE